MILFLDFDGVLHPASVVVGKDRDGQRMPKMQGPGELFRWASALEHALVDLPEVQIVLSTHWVWWFGIERTRAFLPPGLAARVVGATWEGSENMPVGWIHLPRCEQIKLYARRHGISEDWIALDDDDLGLADEDRQHFVICDEAAGLTDPRAQAALRTALEKLA